MTALRQAEMIVEREILVHSSRKMIRQSVINDVNRGDAEKHHWMIGVHDIHSINACDYAIWYARLVMFFEVYTQIQ